MKIKFLKSAIIENKQRYGVALVLFVCLGLVALTQGAAQLRTQRRVTALQLGNSPEGSRVTVVSDLALNDYEAFRRGDRFYVKIPLADFNSAAPHFRADGFEDVQVQRVGDSLIVSFKLQPGATARVDQHGNRLDVIFSTPNRSSYHNTANAASSGGTSRDAGHDAAGPMPAGSVTGSHDRVVTARAAERNYGRATQNPWLPTNPPSGSKTNSGKGAKYPSAVGSNAAGPSPSPRSSPALAQTGASSSYSPLTNATPTLSPNTQVGNSSGSVTTWRQRGSAALRWAAANRLATLLGALILLSLILYLAMTLRNRPKRVSKAKRTKLPKVQPQVQPKHSESNELSQPLVDEQTPRAIQEQRDSRTQPPASAPTAEARAPRHQWELTKPTIASPTAVHDEHSSEEEEREVFEL